MSSISPSAATPKQAFTASQPCLPRTAEAAGQAVGELMLRGKMREALDLATTLGPVHGARAMAFQTLLMLSRGYLHSGPEDRAAVMQAFRKGQGAPAPL